MRIVIAGGSGLIGRALIQALLRQHQSVVLLSRHPQKFHAESSSVRAGFWDAKTSGTVIELIDGADAVINLAGEPIAAHRWTPKQKMLIRSSRVASTHALVNAMKQTRRTPPVLLHASAVGYYGHVPEGEVTEDHQKGEGFLSDVCAQWEAEALNAQGMGVRVVLLRTGIVLDTEGGALKKILQPFRCFLGGPLGSGTQWFPWIHLQDEIGAILFALEHEGITGPLNLAAPESVRMSEFCRTLGKILQRPSWIHVPARVLNLVLGEMAGPLLLDGQKMVPQKLTASGFKFQFPHLEDALNELLGQRRGTRT